MSNLTLITRPIPEAQKTAQQLNDLGYKNFIEPLLTITQKQNTSQQIDKALTPNTQAIIITSSNGLPAIQNHTHIPIIVIGQETGHLATQQKFIKVIIAGNNSQELITHIQNNYSPQNGNFIYISANITTGNIPQKLTTLGYQLQHIIAYTSTPATHLSAKCLELFNNNHIQNILFYSAHTATTFNKLATQAKITKNCNNIDAFCLSQNIANTLSSSMFNNIHIAPTPNNNALITCFNNIKKGDTT